MRDVNPLVRYLYVFISAEFFTGPGEILSFEILSTKLIRLSFAMICLLFGDFEALKAGSTS